MKLKISSYTQKLLISSKWRHPSSPAVTFADHILNSVNTSTHLHRQAGGGIFFVILYALYHKNT